MNNGTPQWWSGGRVVYSGGRCSIISMTFLYYYFYVLYTCTYDRFKSVTARMPEVADSAALYVRARALHPARRRLRRDEKTRLLLIKTQKKKTACAFYRTDSAWTDLVAGVSVPREGEIAIAPEIGLKIPADARAVNIILRVYIYIRINVIRTADDQYIYMRGGCQNVVNNIIVILCDLISVYT